MNFVQIIKACETAEGGGSKLAIRETLATMDDVSLRLVWEGLNPYRVYYIRDFDMPSKGSGTKVDASDIDNFLTVLDKCCAREITGDAARNAVSQAIGKFPSEWHPYLKRIVEGDLKAGFSAETVNKVLIAREMQDENGESLEDCLKEVDKLLKVEGWYQFRDYSIYPKLVPIFTVQLADKCENDEDYESIEYPCQADVKYDGERNVAFVIKDKPVDHYSRSGRIADHMAGLFDEQLQWMRNELGYDFILDGERAASSFEETMNAKKGGNGDAKKAMRIRAYFLMPMNDWIRQKTDITMKQSRETLTDLLKKLKHEFGAWTLISLSEGKIVHDHHEMMEYANEIIDDESRPKSEREGLILKRLNEVYRWERTSTWTKIKRFYPIDMHVVGWYYGNPGSRHAHRMGGVIVEGVDEKGKKFRARCGSGFSDKQRDDPDQFKDATLEIKYQEQTQSSKMKGTDIYSLRFLTVERVRDDKDVDALQNKKRLWGVTLKEAVKFVNEGK